MKHKYLRKLIIASVTASTLLSILPVGASAEWIKNDYGNWAYLDGYSYATGWENINGTWYFFDSMGQMRTGWIQSDGKWYYADLNGGMQTGIIQVEGKIYLFAESGAMQTGTCIINKESYNFNDNGVYAGSSALTPSRAFDYYGNNTIPFASDQIMNTSTGMSSDIPSDGLYHPKQYKVKFKDPDADNSDDELLKTKTVDENTIIALYEPTKSGYTFVEWNTKSDGDGTSYSAGDKINVNKDMTLYAQWEEETPAENNTDTVKVQTITVSSINGIKKIAKGQSLQMTKNVLPSDADNQKVTWSVSNETGQATIDSTGKLTAVSAGTVIVTATAADSSKASGSFAVEISEQ